MDGQGKPNTHGAQSSQPEKPKNKPKTRQTARKTTGGRTPRRTVIPLRGKATAAAQKQVKDAGLNVIGAQTSQAPSKDLGGFVDNTPGVWPASRAFTFKPEAVRTHQDAGSSELENRQERTYDGAQEEILNMLVQIQEKIDNLRDEFSWRMDALEDKVDSLDAKIGELTNKSSDEESGDDSGARTVDDGPRIYFDTYWK